MAEPEGLALRAVGPLAPLQRGHLWCASLQGWRRYLLAFVLGALAATVFPWLPGLFTLNSPPAALVAFTGLVWLADGTQRRRGALMLGWSFGFGFFLSGLYWVTASMLVDVGQYLWLLPIVLGILPGGLALFPALALLASHEACRRFRLTGSARILVLAVAWTAAEWLRGHVFTGFPWNLMGYAWAGDFPGALAMLQLTSVIGIYGLSLLTVTVAALPARLGDLGGGRFWAPLAAVLLIAGAAGWGAWRLVHAGEETVPGVTLRLVQPSIPQTLKNDPQALADNFQRLLELSRSAGADRVSAIIWPEATAPPLLERYPDERRAIASLLPKGGLLLAGTERAEPLQGRPVLVWNSILAIDNQGEIVGHYDKTHLVPLGEYVPWRGILPLDKVVPSIGDFSIGPGPRTLDLPGLPPVSPFICYEAIFPGAEIDPEQRPEWLLNVTNDGWFGATSGPYQHFEIARTRAVEEGVPLVRAGNNGISGVVDPYGRVRARLDLNAVGIVDARLPAALPPTYYERKRDLVFWSLSLLLLAVAVSVSRFDRRLAG